MSRVRHALVATACAGLVVGGLTVGTSPATAAAIPCWDDVATDLDGGGPDVVVGLPSYDVPGAVDAGAIVVFSNVAAHGSADPKKPASSRLLTASDFGIAEEPGARFGAAVAPWQDLADNDDADDCADLLVGAPGTTVLGAAGAGRVYLLGGSETGLSSVKKTFDEGNLVGTGGPEAGDEFGSAIAANTWSTLAIGAPGRDVHEIEDAGRVVRLNWFGIDTEPEVVVIEQDFNEDEDAEAGDQFGEVLDLLATENGDVLVVGVPHEDVGATVDAGAIELFSATTDTISMMTQNRKGAGGQAEAGDLYGSSLDHWWTYTTHPVAMLAIGVPGEDVGTVEDAGSVAFARFDLGSTPEEGISHLKGRSEVLTQDSPGIPGHVERRDRYGTSVLTGEYGQDNGRLNLVVGTPREDLDNTTDAGSVSMTTFETDASPATGILGKVWTQDSHGTPGVAEAGDRFGGRMSSILLTQPEDDTDLTWPVILVTAPQEAVDGDPGVGVAYLGYPGGVAIRLVLPNPQPGAGLEMAPMKAYLG